MVFVGLADGTGGMDELPSDTQLPSDVQDQIDQINQDNGVGGSENDNSSDLCGSGSGGVDFKALADATSGIEGNYASVGRWGCDGDSSCGRGLGRYQFITYREDVRQAILGQPGGSAFYRHSRLDTSQVPPNCCIISHRAYKTPSSFVPKPKTLILSSDRANLAVS